MSNGRERRAAPLAAFGRTFLLRRWRWRLLAAAAIAGVVAFGVAALTPRSYEAKTVLLVGPISSKIDTLLAAGKLALTYGQLATSPHVLAQTERELRLPRAGVHVRATANESTRLITIEASHRDPVVAARIANANARALSGVVARRHPRPGGAGTLQIVDPAQLGSPDAAAWLFGLLGAGAGFFGVVGFAALVGHSGGGVSGAGELRALTGLQILGELSRDRRRGRDDRLLAAMLAALGPRSVLLVCIENEGATVAARVASALRSAGTRVAVLDADAAPAGHALGKRLVEGDVVLAYAPPPARSVSGLEWALAADATVLVARRDRTSAEAVCAALESLQLVGAPPLGAVLTTGHGRQPREAGAGAEEVASPPRGAGRPAEAT